MRRRDPGALAQRLAGRHGLHLEDFAIAAEGGHPGLLDDLLAQLHMPRHPLARARVAACAAAVRRRRRQRVRKAMLLQARR